MIKRQARVAKKAERERGVVPDPGTAAAQRAAKRFDRLRADVGEFAALEVAPDQFDGIQLRRVAGQPFDGEPRALARQVGAHGATVVSGEPVPDQDHGAAAKGPFEGSQESNEGVIVVAAGPRLKEEPRAPAIPPKRQRARHGQPAPVAADMAQDGRFAARRPRPSDDRMLREPALVLEDEPGAATAGVFFTCAHRRVFQRAIASSSRSRACRAGRCSDQPSPRSTRHTWPGWCCTPVTCAITAATRGKVHNSVPKPCAPGPARSARSTRASCAASNRGLRPKRPAPLSPARPWAFHVWNQWCALTRVTPNAFATAACDSPRANSRAASSRRASIAATSRAGVDMPQHAIVRMKSVTLFSESH